MKRNRIFHLQIQEGELLPKGQINMESLRWKPLDNYRIFDSNIVNGVDFFTMDHTKRHVDLDELIGDDPDDIVIGVKFRSVGNHLNLEIKLCKFDFNSGKLDRPNKIYYWKSNDKNEFSFDRRWVSFFTFLFMRIIIIK